MVVMVGRCSDDSACLLVHDVQLYSVLNTVVLSSDKFIVVLCLTLWLVCLCLVLYCLSC